MVYYRKYRPQLISELDLESVRTRLSSILSAKELPHAFLFTGPKGLGKTSSARILAKAINCENNPRNVIARSEETKQSKIDRHAGARDDNSIEPCNKCDACVSVTNGSNLDVIEIDAASNRGIDEIRDLREKIKYSPAALAKKVYIIDEVHMLTTDAFNALLKTLEEPPSHAVFILCTTEVDKVPPTISSRTFHVQFQLPTMEEIVHSLERIIKGEKIELDQEVLEEVYKLSEGSFRDAAKILEDLVINSDKKKITLSLVNNVYKTQEIYVAIHKLLSDASRKDVKEALGTISSLVANGSDFKVVTEKVAYALHEMLMGRNPFKTQELLDFSEQELKVLLKLVNDSYRDIKFSVLPQIPLELVVVEWCLGDKIQNSKFKVQSSEGEEKEDKKVDLNSDGARGSELSLTQKIKPNPKTQAEIQNLDIPESKPEEPKRKEAKIEERKETEISAGSENKSKHDDMFAENALASNFFISLITLIKRDNHSIAGILRGCKLIEMKDGKIIFETKYKFHKDKLSDPKVRSVLDLRASELLREKVQVVVNQVG